MPQPPPRNRIGLPFIELQSVDSTNNYARQQIHAGLAQHGTSFFAYEQLQGRGQRGKHWLSGPRQNLILTTVIDPFPLKLPDQFQLSACVAVAVHDFFSRYATAGTTIKWPNDIYWHDRKAGGILIENIVGRKLLIADSQTRQTTDLAWTSIVGIGININQESFDPSLTRAVSLRQITGKTYELTILAKQLLQGIDQHFNQLMCDGFEPIYEHYLSVLYKRGEEVRLRKDHRTFNATIKGVDKSGWLTTVHAIEESFNHGDVEWLF